MLTYIVENLLNLKFSKTFTFTALYFLSDLISNCIALLNYKKMMKKQKCQVPICCVPWSGVGVEVISKLVFSNRGNSSDCLESFIPQRFLFL